MAENFSNLKKKGGEKNTTYPDTENTEGFKQDEPKQTHTKIHHN